MGQALYRKYRSRSFGEVVGQDHITRTLQNALKSGKISHAYLFTGPRGVGKTSVARILAHEVNGLDYKDETIHLDIIEIDAASNRRIDEIRDLRDKVKIAPAAARFKVYIIDEVHMLTREAFNALLKTLEEPPAHCIFILATTEAHKLPETIISRTQRFEFKPVNTVQVSAHLTSIAKKEKIDIEPEALELLAESGNGSFRDSISYLDQLSAYDKKVSVDDVRQILGLPLGRQIDSLLTAIEGGDLSSVMSRLRSIEQKGVSAAAVAAGISDRLRSLAQQNLTKAWQIQLLSSLLNVSANERPQEALEIALLQAATLFDTNSSAVGIVDDADGSAAAVNSKSSEPSVDRKPISAEKETFDLTLWDNVLERSKKEAASVYTALKLAVPVYEDGELMLKFQFPLHQKKLSQAKNKQLVGQIIEQLTGKKVIVEAVVDKAIGTPEPLSKPDTMSPGVINNIFGGAEVMEA